MNDLADIIRAMQAAHHWIECIAYKETGAGEVLKDLADALDALKNAQRELNYMAKYLAKSNAADFVDTIQ